MIVYFGLNEQYLSPPWDLFRLFTNSNFYVSAAYMLNPFIPLADYEVVNITDLRIRFT